MWVDKEELVLVYIEDSLVCKLSNLISIHSLKKREAANIK
jgi:hypothetical protein